MKYFILTTFWALIAQTVSDDVYSHLGHRSPYRFNANTDVTVDEELQQCSTKIWGLVRHGTRYPLAMETNEIVIRVPEIRDLIVEANVDGNGPLSDDIIGQLREWLPEERTFEEELILAPEGELESYDLAQRMQKRYPYTLPNVFDNDTYSFQYTAFQRNVEGARQFAIGLFGEEHIDEVYFPTISREDSSILVFYEECSKWNSEIKRNRTLIEEKTLFAESSYVTEMVRKTNEAVGLTDELSTTDTQLMHLVCAYETALYRNTTSPWCELFTEETIKVIEYLEDLDYYWYSGYGYELNYKIACPVFKDLISFFDEETEKKALLYFGHGETLMKFIAHLGLYKDDVDLLHDNYETNDDRLWRISKIASFGANFMFVLHECDGVKSVTVLHNERIVRLPACPDSDTCSYEAIKTYFEESINCNFDEMCSSTSGAHSTDRSTYL